MTAAASTLSPVGGFKIPSIHVDALADPDGGLRGRQSACPPRGDGTKSAIRPVPNLPPGYREPPAHLAARIAGVIASCSRHRAHGQLDN